MIQVIKCPCGKIFAACCEPECYSDAEWQKNMRGYVKKGCKPEMIEHGSGWEFEKCTCKNMKPAPKEVQTSLF